jgi:predicted nucleic-acid-binding Zn-ribbon protein
MKHSHTCLKCAGTEIVRVEVVRGAHGSVNVIPTDGRWIKVTRYVCLHCGYCEMWIDSPDDLKNLRRLAGRQSSGVWHKIRAFLGCPVFEKLDSKPKGNSHG